MKEVSELLSISLGGTYTLVREGQIPAIKLGGRWVIPKKRFHAWLEAGAADDGSGFWDPIPGLGAKRLDRLQSRDNQTWINQVARACQCCVQGKDAARH